MNLEDLKEYKKLYDESRKLACNKNTPKKDKETLFKINDKIKELLINAINIDGQKHHHDCAYYDEGEYNEYCGMSGMQICDNEICVEFTPKEALL
ncbi:MAG: hypothetical protein ISP01_05325 [Methanobrevibacter arboriphilus]|uniref:Uncharacterized protein n=1 Tax=Methanobrevibacter arboriphilus TaxID=39441 RepID=A0A843ANE1_METAZ|nr:hypothetical protein [Methanobrevibacter arboriphilus]MBF4468809.1 hypothetical protein [Methanobrevibacter arboriphilus]